MAQVVGAADVFDSFLVHHGLTLHTGGGEGLPEIVCTQEDSLFDLGRDDEALFDLPCQRI